MLCSLSIRNVVLIDRLDLEFSAGFSVLTGETGAGKSILLDSLGLVLGSRAETSLIRRGEDKLSVTAVFSLPPAGHPLYRLAEEYDLDLEDELVIKRTLDVNGRGKIFINDQPVSLKVLKEFGRVLVEVHGQFDNQGLLNPASHRDILDGYGKYPEACAEVREKYALYRQAAEERRAFEENLNKAKTDEENLRCWVDELEKLNPAAGEEADGNDECRKTAGKSERRLWQSDLGRRRAVGRASCPGGNRPRQPAGGGKIRRHCRNFGADFDQRRRVHPPD